jgi:Putative lumazine-binding
MKKITLILLLAAGPALAQTNEAVMKPVHTLFEAMKSGDTAVIRKVFHPDAVLFTVTKEAATGQPTLRKETLPDFLAAVGKPRTDVYNEQVWNEKVFVDGDFAQVWTDYAFYLNTAFHHCGVDAFQLIRSARGEWLIYGLSDTRRKTGCDVPEEVKRRVK